MDDSWDSLSPTQQHYADIWSQRQAMPLLEVEEILDGRPYWSTCTCNAVGFGLDHSGHCDLWGRRTEWGVISRGGPVE